MDARPRVLILALANWFGAPRLPRPLGRAGFHVTSFGLTGLLIQRSQAVDEALIVPESIAIDELPPALLSAIERSRADVVIATDDTSISVLHAAAVLAQDPDVPERTRSVIAASLGDLRHLPTLRSRKLLANLAAAAGVRIPDHAEVFSEADALLFAGEFGFPVVLKEEDSSSGMGVAICKDEAELCAAIFRSSQNPAVFGQGVLAQRFVEGRTAMRLVLARRGRVLGGLSAIKLETWPTSTGPSTCVEFIEHAEMKAASEALIGELGYSGFASLDFMLDGNGGAHLIELNPRPTPIAHLGERFAACLCRKLYASITGQEVSADEPRGLPCRVALFPQEWVRDASSTYLSSGVYHDVPWEEPDLVEAYMNFGRSQMRFMGYDRQAIRNDGLRSKLAELERATPLFPQQARSSAMPEGVEQ